MNTFQAVVFDMDGLLLDTESICMRIFKEACETLHVPFLNDAYLSIIGCNSTHIFKTLHNAYHDIIDYTLIHDEWRKQYNNVVENRAIPKKNGVIDVLLWLKNHQIPIAVATSTHKSLAIRKLELAGIAPLFEVITGGDEIKKSKPDPDIYLKAAKRLHIHPSKCIAFEDSSNGVISATAAGMRTYQVPDLINPTSETKHLAYKIISQIDNALDDFPMHFNQ